MERIRCAIAGLLAAALALGTTELVAGLLGGGVSLFVAVGDTIISLTPGAVARFAIANFGSNNRLVLLLSMTLVVAIAGALIGIAAARRPWVGVAGIAAFGLLGALAGLSEPLVPTSTALVAPTVGVIAGIVVLRFLLRVAAPPDELAEPVGASMDRVAVPASAGTGVPSGSSGGPGGSHEPGVPGGSDELGRPGGQAPADDPERPPRTRRSFLGFAVATAGAAAGFAVLGRSLQSRAAIEVDRLATRLPTVSDPLPAPPPATTLEVPGISPLITPNSAFYRIDTALTVPRVDGSTHRVGITGMVDEPFEISYDELLELADTEEYVTLSCVSNLVGGDLVGNALWLGVPLADLLERAGVQPGATQIVGRSVDGWTGGFPVEAAFDGRTALVAVGMNGEPLPADHGYPVRLVISGLYGYVSDTKWLSEIELTTFDAYDAYWIPRGWSRMGPIKTQSRIDVPGEGGSVTSGPVVVAGVAWGDERGVSAVEVSVDDGAWQPAELAAELSPTSWRQWKMDWDASPGVHILKVRAFDGDGQPQTPEEAPPAPNGASGHHDVRVQVT